MKSKVVKSSQVCATAMCVQCSCSGDCYESIYGSAWIDEWENISNYHFKCEDCDQKWTLPKNMNIVVKFQRRK